MTETVTTVFVPIPTDQVSATKKIWLPFVEQISARDKCDPSVKVRMFETGEAQIFIAWNEEKKEARAFLGAQFLLRGDERMAQLLWATGEDMAEWRDLLGDVETYLREHQACKAVRAIARPGWSKHLRANGYRETHRIFDKELTT